MGRRDEFLKLFLRHEADLRAFIGSLILDRSVHEDMLQDVALALWQQIDAYDRTRPFGTWARGVPANKVLQQRRRDARFPLAFAPETVQAILDAYDRTEETASRRQEALHACLEQLPDHSCLKRCLLCLLLS